MDNVENLARILWDYHYVNQPVEKSDYIIALGNSDIRTAQKAAELFNQGMGATLVTTGGFGRLTKDTLVKPEAHLFADEAILLGVPKAKVIIEDQSTNTFDNMRFTKQLLSARGIHPKSIIVVTKPYMERRAFETFRSVWSSVTVHVTSPDLTFDTYPNDVISTQMLINMLVGDQQRLMIFSDSRNIRQQQFPSAVIDAFEQLIALGFDEQIIPQENIPNLLSAVATGNAWHA